MEHLIKRLEDLQPRPSLEGFGHHGGFTYDLFNTTTVGSEALRLTVQVYRPGGYTEGHPIHTDREQAYYIISGTMTLTLNDKTYTVPAGSFVFLPRGVEHNHRNDGEEALVILTVNCPVRSGEVPPMPA